MKDEPLDQLIKSFAALPGLGPRSARRVALTLLTNKEKLMAPLVQALVKTSENIKICAECGNLDTASPCRICQDDRRPQNTICVIADISDLWAIERTGSYKGLYHVLGGVLSALDGIGPDDLAIFSLLERVRTKQPDEIILALGATVDGQATVHYLTDRLQNVTQARISRLACGVPVGGELDYLDEGTIATALKARAAV